MSVPASRSVRLLAAILLLVGAALAIVLPLVSATFLTIVIGAVAIAAGISQLLRLTAPVDLRGKVFRALSGLLYLIGGLWVLAFPLDSLLSLTLFLGFLLVFEGLMELATAAASATPASGIVLLDGIVTVILGGLLVAQWPTDSVWAIGTLFGVTLAFSAVNLLSAPDPAAS